MHRSFEIPIILCTGALKFMSVFTTNLKCWVFFNNLGCWKGQGARRGKAKRAGGCPVFKSRAWCFPPSSSTTEVQARHHNLPSRTGRLDPVEMSQCLVDSGAEMETGRRPTSSGGDSKQSGGLNWSVMLGLEVQHASHSPISAQNQKCKY